MEIVDDTDDTDECQNAGCTRMEGRCVGWHCPHCGLPCSMMGHDCAVAIERAWDREFGRDSWLGRGPYKTVGSR